MTSLINNSEERLMANPRREFEVLNRQCGEMKKKLMSLEVMSAARLIDIRNHIEVCDHLVDTNFEKDLLFRTHFYWEKCCASLEKDTPEQDGVVVPDLVLKTNKFPGIEPRRRTSTVLMKVTQQITPRPEKNPDEDLAQYAKRFLASLGIKDE